MVESRRAERLPEYRRVTFRLKPVPPFRLDLTAWALRRRDTNIVDRFDCATYRRVLVLRGQPVEVKLKQSGSVLAPQVIVRATSLRAVNPNELEPLLESMLGTRVDLQSFYNKARELGGLGRLVARFRGVKPPRFPTVFEALVNAVACQQLSLSAGMQLLNRLTQHFGTKFSDEESMGYAFPNAGDLADLNVRDLRHLGFSTRKSGVLIEIARRVAEGNLDVDRLGRMNDPEAAQLLDDIPGIGRWSAEYALLRGLGRTNVFPGDDVGARNKLREEAELHGKLDYDQVKRVLLRWAPFQGLLYFHLLLSQLERRGYVSGVNRNE